MSDDYRVWQLVNTNTYLNALSIKELFMRSALLPNSNQQVVFDIYRKKKKNQQVVSDINPPV